MNQPPLSAHYLSPGMKYFRPKHGLNQKWLFRRRLSWLTKALLSVRNGDFAIP
jgi:hypothetical protein